MEIIHELKRPTFNIKVYKSHVEITDRSGCFGIFMPKNISIPVKTIAGIDVTPMTEKLTIKTIDGKSYKFSVGGMGGVAKGVRDAIFSAME